MFTLLVALAASSTLAADTSLNTSTRVGVAANPGGLISDNRIQVRRELSDSDHILLQDTFAGAGARLAVTPAFAEVGPRLSIAPLAIFDMDIQASYLRYFGGNIGLMPFDAPVDKRERDRNPREDGFASDALSLTASPTFKIKLGPVIALDTWAVSALHVAQPGNVDAPFTYEPYRDLVVAWDEVTVEHQGIVLYEITDEREMARVGLTARDRRAVVSKDRSITAGLVAMARPGEATAVPTLVAQVLWYVDDADRTLTTGGPALQALASWTLDRRLGRVQHPGGQ